MMLFYNNDVFQKNEGPLLGLLIAREIIKKC